MRTINADELLEWLEKERDKYHVYNLRHRLIGDIIYHINKQLEPKIETDRYNYKQDKKEGV